MRNTAFIILALSLSMLSGCADKFMHDEDYGRAYRMQLQSQKLNPETPPATPVEGMDGRLAANHMNKLTEPKEDSGPSFADVITSLMKKK